MYRANFLVSPQQVIKSPGFEGKYLLWLMLAFRGECWNITPVGAFFVAESQGQKKISDLPVFNFI